MYQWYVNYARLLDVTDSNAQVLVRDWVDNSILLAVRLTSHMS